MLENFATVLFLKGRRQILYVIISSALIFKQSMGARSGVGIGLLYRPASAEIF
jgi:hypothetical protein